MKNPPRIDQFVAGFSVGDATSNAVLLMRDRLRALGFSSTVYAPSAYVMPAIRSECRSLEAYDGKPHDIVLHHFGLWSDVTDFFLRVPARKVLVYHNITPADYFRGYDDTVADQLANSAGQLPRVLAACEAIWADSPFNADEIQSLSDKPVQVFALPYAPAINETEPDERTLRRLQGPVTTLLSVGRMAPNKRLEELIEAFAIYRRTYDPFSRLVFVGSDRSAPRYVTRLRLLAHEWNVPNVAFEGFVWPEALRAYYRAADLYLSASDHEGYCLPLLEAMCEEVPVIAKRTGGTPFAMNDAGVLYEHLSATELAALMARVLNDPALGNAVRASQQRRVREIMERDLTAELSALLAPLIDGAPASETPSVVRAQNPT